MYYYKWCLKISGLRVGHRISLERPWRRETMHNLLGNDLDAVKAATLSALNMGPNNQDIHLIEACSSVGQVLNEVFEMVVEPTLVQPSFVLDYPVEISPLAKPTKMPHNTPIQVGKRSRNLDTA
ncbi:hypothetical protein OSB04_028705 [Centaurea solstitialis]|uniref:Uncharacterized protein n=1 Tax=Centaurea solstitialis TaxID=347529 RepID=A0AA38SHT0_9ASTR|nr:hypothetical protein OSB04_028705 [Centaurea solstitialis]